MKRILLPLAFFLFAFAPMAKAQPSTCTITGTIYRSSGAVCASCQVTLSKARRGSVPLGSGTQTFTTNASGVLPNDFQAVQNSFVTITGQFTIGRYNFQTGLEVYIPAQSSIAIESLQSAEDALLASIGATGSAATTEPFITKTATSGLSNEFALGSLATGLLKNTTTTGVPTIAVAGTDYLPSIASLTADASPDGAADYVVTYDASAAAHKKVLLNNLPGGGGGGAVSSVFGRTGTVTAASNDYTWAQIDKTTSSLADITTRSASDLSSGTLPDGRFPATLPAVSGVNLTALNASNLGSGTLPDARFPATLPAASGANLTALNASNLGSGTLPDARFPATLPAASGVNLTALNASNLGSGTVPLARLSGITTAELSATAGITNAQLAGSIAASKLVGTDIATVGTITAGTWNGSVIGGAYGGAGTANGILKANGSGTVSAATAGTDYVAPGAVTGSGLTMATARLLGRSTASTGAIEEITVGSGLTLSAGTLSASGGGGTPGGSGSELQFRGGASTFSAVTGSSVSGANISLAPDATTGNGLSIAGPAITSGNLVSIAASGTAAAGNGKHALLVATSGANATSSQTTYGAEITNTSTGTSSTNVGLAVGASGGTANVGLRVVNGANNQRLQVYETFTDESNYSRLEIARSGNYHLIVSQSAGTGTLRGLNFSGGPTGGDIALLTTGAILFGRSGVVNSWHIAAGGNLTGNSGVSMGFTSSGDPTGTADTLFRRAAAAVIALEGASTTAAALSSPARTPSQITANQNDYAPGVGLFQRWSSDASRNVTGRSAGQAGEFSYVWNVGSFDIVLVHESASSTAANRFTNSGGADITVTPGRVAFMQYDTTSSRWRVVLLFILALRIRIRRRAATPAPARRRIVLQ